MYERNHRNWGWTGRWLKTEVKLVDTNQAAPSRNLLRSCAIAFWPEVNKDLNKSENKMKIKWDSDQGSELPPRGWHFPSFIGGLEPDGRFLVMAVSVCGHLWFFICGSSQDCSITQMYKLQACNAMTCDCDTASATNKKTICTGDNLYVLYCILYNPVVRNERLDSYIERARKAVSEGYLKHSGLDPSRIPEPHQHTKLLHKLQLSDFFIIPIYTPANKSSCLSIHSWLPPS
jgi:hypothetical protein